MKHIRFVAQFLLALGAPLVALTILLSAPLVSTLSFPGFSSHSGVQLVQSASILGDRLRLTPARSSVVGAAWFVNRVFVSRGFETEFRFQLTGQGGRDNGADGFAFVLQNVGPEAAGSPGSAGGFGLGSHEFTGSRGIPQSIAVFFDTFRNVDEGDPSDNFISICTNGAGGTLRWPPRHLAYIPRVRSILKDGRVHRARIEYNPPLFYVYLDDMSRPVLRSSVDLATVTDSAGSSYIGFTASTGAGWENHDILDWSFSITQPEQVKSSIEFNEELVTSDIVFAQASCLPNRNLCTPERATVETLSEGRYRVLLPANLEWGVSIPNPSGGAPIISKALGHVCWDLRSLGAAGCNGPGGNGSIAGPGFLVPESAAGALVFKTTGGRTYFSVNGRSRNVDRPYLGITEFREHEGSFEFEAKIP